MDNQVVPEKSTKNVQQQQQQQSKYKRFKKKDKAKNKKKFLKGSNENNNKLQQMNSGPKTAVVDSILFYDDAGQGIYKSKFDKQFELKEEKILMDYIEHTNTNNSSDDNEILSKLQFNDTVDTVYSKPIKNSLKRSKYYQQNAQNNQTNNQQQNGSIGGQLQQLQLDSDDEIDLDLEASSYKKKCRLQRILTKKNHQLPPQQLPLQQSLNNSMNSSQNSNSSGGGRRKERKFSRNISFVKSNTNLNDETSNLMPDIPPPLVKRVSFTLPSDKDIIFLSSASSSDISRSATPILNTGYPQLNNSQDIPMDPSLNTSNSSISNIYNDIHIYYNNLVNRNREIFENPNSGYDNIEEFEDDDSSGSYVNENDNDIIDEDDEDDEDMLQSEEEFDDENDATDMELPVFEISHFSETTTTSYISSSFDGDDVYDSLTESSESETSERIVSSYINSEPSGDEGFFTNPFKPKVSFDQQAPKSSNSFSSSSASASSSSSSLFGSNSSNTFNFMSTHSHLFAPLCSLPKSPSAGNCSTGGCNDVSDSDDYMSGTEESEYSDIEVSSRTSSFSEWIKKVHGQSIVIPKTKPQTELQISPRHHHLLQTSDESIPNTNNNSNNSNLNKSSENLKTSQESLESFIRRSDNRSLFFRPSLDSYINDCLENNSVLKKEILEINDKGLSLSVYSIKQLTSISNLFDYFIMGGLNQKEFPLWSMSKIPTLQVEFLARQYNIYNSIKKIKGRKTIFLYINQGIRKPSNKKKDNFILTAFDKSTNEDNNDGSDLIILNNSIGSTKVSPPKNHNHNSNYNNTNNNNNNKKDKKDKKTKKEKKKYKKNKKLLHQQQQQQQILSPNSNGKVKPSNGDIVAGDVKPISSSNVGHSILKNLGWTPGAGLGLLNQGMEEPIQVTVRKHSYGLGFQ